MLGPSLPRQLRGDLSLDTLLKDTLLKEKGVGGMREEMGFGTREGYISAALMCARS